MQGNQPKTSKKLFIAILIIIAVVSSFLGGYGLSLASRSAPTEAITIIDDLGRLVSIPSEVNRIISLAPSTTEILFAIGLGPRVVAVDAVSDHPTELQELDLTRINTYPGVELETILALKPDLVVAADIIALSDIDRISAQGIPVLVLGPKTIDGILENILLVGLVTGTLTSAQQLVSSLESRISAVLTITTNATLVPERPLVYLEFFPFWSFGPGSFGHDLIIMAGGRNVGASMTTPFGEVSNEFIIATDPDVIIFTVGSFTQTTEEDIINRPGWDSITAVKESRIFTIDDNEVARTGPRIVDALEDLAKTLHPDLFDQG